MRKLSWLLFLIFAFCSCSTPNSAYDYEVILTDYDMTNAEDLSLEDIFELNNRFIEIGYSPETSKVREIDGKYSTIKVSNRTDAVKSLSSVRSLYGIDSLEFSCILDEERTDFRVFELQQLYYGIPVFGGYFRIAADYEGTTCYIRGDYIICSGLNVEPSYSKTAVKKVITDTYDGKVKETILFVYVGVDRKPILAWRIYLKTGDILNDKHIFVDALTGEILCSYPLAIA